MAASVDRHSGPTMSASLDTPSQPGLSETAAAARLQRDGYNELPSAQPRSVVAIALEVVREPMFILLIASGAIYLLLGDPAEAVALLAAVFLVIGITLYQEQKTERALQALRELSSPRALVVRGGVTKRIAGRDVVQGDLIVLREGDRVPADACVESCRNLFVDESLMTGESVPVRKVPTTINAPPAPLVATIGHLSTQERSSYVVTVLPGSWRRAAEPNLERSELP